MTDTPSADAAEAAAAAAAGASLASSSSIGVDREPAAPSHSNRDGAASPTNANNKRHITTVLNPYTQPSRTAPSPPKSPVRLRAGGAHSGGDTESPSRSPIRMAARERERNFLGVGHASASSSACHSPTRSGISHGLPASPQTPTRTRSQLHSSGSTSPPLSSALNSGTRSPIGAFWFPHGMPPSPGSKLHTQSALSQLAVTHPRGLDLAAIEQVTASVIKLPKYCAPYVQQQCLSIQQHKAELQALVRENRAQELAHSRLQRRMQLLRRGGIAGRSSNRSSLGTLSAAINQASLSSGTDMSIDDNAMPALVSAQSADSAVSPSAAAVAAPALVSPTSLGHLGRSRNASTTSTTSSVQTSLSAPSSPPSNTDRADAADAGDGNDSALDASAEALLSPLSISRMSRAAPRSAPSSASSSLLQVSSLHGGDLIDEVDEDLDESEVEEAAAAAAATAAPEQRVLHQTFNYYFTHHLEKFKDPNTRFFRVLLGAIDYLMDAPGDSGSPSAATEGAEGDISALALDSSSPMSRATRLRRLNVASSHVSAPILSTASPVAPAAPLSSSPMGAALQRHHFAPLLDAILSNHPGLEFLQQPEFQSKYAQTVIERVFFALDSKGHGRLSLADLRRSNLLAEVAALQAEPDINRSVHYFSYQHFYVLYCKFWELDSPDHDGFLSLRNLRDYEGGALSATICQRIIDACPRPETNATAATTEAGQTAATEEGAAPMATEVGAGASALAESDEDAPRMDYLSFIPFMLAEVDKTTAPSLNYWFRLLDVDCDRVLSLFELDYFWAEQGEKVQQLSSDVIQWRDIVCQLLDMIKGGSGAGGGSSGNGVPSSHAHGLLPPASGALHRNVSSALPALASSAAPALAARASSDSLSHPRPSAAAAPSSSSSSSSSCSSSSLRYEFSSCHITRKDLRRSGLQSYFLNLFFNLQRFLSHESRDPVKARQQHEAQEQGISEWELFAAASYQSLVANEELQARAAEQQQTQMHEYGHGDERGHGYDGDHEHERGLDAHGHSHGDAFDHGQHCAEDDDIDMDDEQQQRAHRAAVESDDPPPSSEQRQQVGGDDAEMAVHDVSLHEGDHAASAAHTSSSGAGSESLSVESRELMQQRWGIGDRGAGVRVVSGSGGPDGAAPHCFFVHDVDCDSPIEAAHHDEQHLARSNGSSPRSPMQQGAAAAAAAAEASPTAAQRIRLREEERAFLELQRKIHSGDSASPSTADVLSPSRRTSTRAATTAAVDDDDEVASPSALSRPISIPSAASGASPQLAKLHLHHAHANSPAPLGHGDEGDAHGNSGASVSPPYVDASAPLRCPSPHLEAMAAAPGPKHGQLELKDDPVAAGAPTVCNNKENALPALSPLGRSTATPVAAGGSGSMSIKRQLFTQAAADKQPLSPTRSVQPYHH